jgi:hypothetical protein
MSSRLIDSHGPFTFVFKPDRDWYKLFTEVVYDGVFASQFFKGREEEASPEEWALYTFTHKIEDFQDEREHWAPGSIHFDLDDIQQIIFREKSAGARIHPIIAKRNYRKIRERFSLLIPA